MRITVPTLLALALVNAAACSADRRVENDTSALRGVTNADTSSLTHVATLDPAILTTIGGVNVHQGGYGSAIAFVSGNSRDLYMLTDRGPNVDWDDGAGKAFVDPAFSPRIVRTRIDGDKIVIDGEILFKSANGTPLNGLPPGSGCGSTGELAFHLTTSNSATPIRLGPNGLDPEGLVAMSDGTFWISDEYGPFVVHFSADGRELSRHSPCNDGGIPAVYAKRRPNRGMEGLTITPDQQWLVGIMQAPLENPGIAGVRNTSRVTRILFKNLANGSTREYLYILDDPTLEGNSEILALSATKFLVLERDDRFPDGTPAALEKKIYEIDITGATDVSKLGALGQAPANGKTLEAAALSDVLAVAAPVSKTLRVNLLDLGWKHDKAEGMAMASGNILLVSNDNDFGITVIENKAPTPNQLIQKVLAGNGAPDKVQVFQIKLK